MERVYLDYSATTPANSEVVDTFSKVSLNYIGNPNSLHKLGVEAKKLMDASCNQVASLLKVKPSEVIFTSGSSESNNLAILGTVMKYPNRGKHIITTRLEHSSVLECMNYLESIGYTIDYVNIDENGMIDIAHFKELLNKNTVLVSIGHVNSEVGFIQNVNEIGKILKDYPTTIYHVDGTQAVGKIKIDLTNIDLYSFSSHKFYGLKGVGVLIKKNGIEIEPLVHGGKSQTIYRSGTPPLALIASCSKALRLCLEDFDTKYQKIVDLNKYLIDKLSKIDGIIINSNNLCVPHIVNVSVLNIKPETMLHALEEYNIYISTKTACSKDNSDSLTLTTIGKDTSIAGHSIRISLSYLTTLEEIDYFIDKFKLCINSLNFRK